MIIVSLLRESAARLWNLWLGHNQSEDRRAGTQRPHKPLFLARVRPDLTKVSIDAIHSRPQATSSYNYRRCHLALLFQGAIPDDFHHIDIWCHSVKMADFVREGCEAWRWVWGCNSVGARGQEFGCRYVIFTTLCRWGTFIDLGSLYTHVVALAGESFEYREDGTDGV